MNKSTWFWKVHYPSWIGQVKSPLVILKILHSQSFFLLKMHIHSRYTFQLGKVKTVAFPKAIRTRNSNNKRFTSSDHLTIKISLTALFQLNICTSMWPIQDKAMSKKSQQASSTVPLIFFTLPVCHSNCNLNLIYFQLFESA